MRVFCFGDSNTYGYDARSLFGERLSKEERWPEIFGQLSGWEIVNEGMNGREIPHDSWSLARFDKLLLEAGPVDLTVIMLGSNDLLNSYRPDIEKIGNRMEQFVRHVLEQPAIKGDGRRLLLVAPAPMDVGRFREEDGCYDREAEKFGACYKEIAVRNGLRFADASQWQLPLAHDGVHFTPEGHALLAEGLWSLLKNDCKMTATQ